ncbi:Peptidyl-prolyl isomerase cwc27 [Eufriesea mexicana]|uniref:Peptidyl-prolyl isomerase cwc27 n=1 Tax=Eufriesea mexicana TaxID=516756 RepID=A0A310SC01_9HYME|nr:Peptidyl-prolyl isomerase cwc27 [Eufriesea mexicana]
MDKWLELACLGPHRSQVVFRKLETKDKTVASGEGLYLIINSGIGFDKANECAECMEGFGRLFEKQGVTGETIYNVLKLEKTPVDENDRLLYPPRLLKSIILSNPFSVIISRITVENSEEVKDSSKTKTAMVKDFNLLSFAEEAEEDEEECVILNKKSSGMGKSGHNHLTDPKLSSQPAFEPPSKAMKEKIRNKLRGTKKEPRKVEKHKIDDVEDNRDIEENK